MQKNAPEALGVVYRMPISDLHPHPLNPYGTLNRFEDGYWVPDTEVKQFEIKSHEDVSIYFKNCHGGKLQIQKSMQSSGPVSGWQFRITDSDGKEISGSPFTTDENGVILTGTILPGEYTVEELIPEDSAYPNRLLMH